MSHDPRHPRFLTPLALMLSLTLMLAACPEPEPTATDVPDAETDTLPNNRTYLMGGVAIDYDINAPGRYVITVDKLVLPVPDSGDAGDAGTAGDAAGSDADADTGPEDLTEAIVLPLYHLGIPWDEFSQPQVSSLPGAWVNAIDAAVAELQGLDKPLAIALSPTSIEWDNLAPRASDGGGGTLSLQENWLLSACHDPSQDGNPKQWEEAYVRYVSWMVDRFKPDFVFLARRINRYDERCGKNSPNAYAAIANFATAAHIKLQELSSPPTTVVTVDVEDLYGFTEEGKKPGRCVIETPEECFEQRKGLLDAFTADRVGLESYPAVALPIIKSIPADWLDRVAAYRSDMAPIIAGTGLPAERMESPQGVCIPLLETSESLQLLWLDQVFGVAAAYEMELVVWGTPMDLVSDTLIAPCQCTGDFETCEHLKQLGAKADQVRLTLIEGLFASDGTTREAGRVWLEQLR